MSNHCAFTFSEIDGSLFYDTPWRSTGFFADILPITILLIAVAYDIVNHIYRLRAAWMENVRDIAAAVGWWALDIIFVVAAVWLVFAAHRPWAGTALYCVGGTVAWALVRMWTGGGIPRVAVSLSGPRTSFSVDW